MLDLSPSPSPSRLLSLAFVVSQIETGCCLWDHTCSYHQARRAGNPLESVYGVLDPRLHPFRHAYNHLGGNVLKDTDFMQAFKSLVMTVQCCQPLVPYCPDGAPVRVRCNLLGVAVSKTPIGLQECTTCQLSRKCAPAPLL